MIPSKYAVKDAKKILALAAKRRLKGSADLGRQLGAGAVQPAALKAFLETYDWEWLDTYSKRTVSQLKKYLTVLEHDPDAAYATDTRTQAVSAARSNTGRVSKVLRFSIADAFAVAADSMTPEQRGKALEAWLKANQRS